MNFVLNHADNHYYFLVKSLQHANEKIFNFVPQAFFKSKKTRRNVSFPRTQPNKKI